jgi:hypothetical protein
MYLGVDAWQVPNGFDIIGVVMYRLKDGKNGEFKLGSMPLDFIQLTQSHTGEYLAQMVQHIVEKFGVENRPSFFCSSYVRLSTDSSHIFQQICGIVAENAANNKTMMDELKKLQWKRFKGKPQWIRYFAHILNLVVKAIL